MAGKFKYIVFLCALIFALVITVQMPEKTWLALIVVLVAVLAGMMRLDDKL